MFNFNLTIDPLSSFSDVGDLNMQDWVRRGAGRGVRAYTPRGCRADVRVAGCYSFKTAA